MRLSIQGHINELMNRQIKEFHIGFNKLGSTLGHAANELLYPVKIFLPAHLGGGRFFYHVLAFFKVENEYDCGIAVEYGGKEKGGGYLPSSSNSILNYFQSYIYGRDGGLRYQMMTYSDFLNKCSTTFINNMKLIIRKSNPPTINQLLNSICNDSSWRKRDYNLLNNNCQDFVVECIKRLDAVRGYAYNNFRGYHNLAVAHYPFKIIEQLEKNENDSQTEIDKIPIIGPIQEGIRAIYGLFNQ